MTTRVRSSIYHISFINYKKVCIGKYIYSFFYFKPITYTVFKLKVLFNFLMKICTSSLYLNFFYIG